MKFFKNSKKQKVQVPEAAPRALEEIQREYAETSHKAGQAQYQVFVYTEELSAINGKLYSLNLEAAKRNALDAKSKAAQEAQGEANG